MPRTLRILVARPGAGEDGRSAQLLARALSDRGIEVVYAGLEQTPEMIAATAIQEAVDAIGLAMNGEPAENAARVASEIAAVEQALEARGADDLIVFDGNVVSANAIVDRVLRARVA
jgi:methylmalonyl-CoA mutase C-terminal domain/subunit